MELLDPKLEPCARCLESIVAHAQTTDLQSPWLGQLFEETSILLTNPPVKPEKAQLGEMRRRVHEDGREFASVCRDLGGIGIAIH